MYRGRSARERGASTTCTIDEAKLQAAIEAMLKNKDGIGQPKVSVQNVRIKTFLCGGEHIYYFIKATVAVAVDTDTVTVACVN